jgi:F-type H+-transporting ATPase subunit a
MEPRRYGVVRRRRSRHHHRSGAWTFKNFFEIIAESLFKLTENVIGHHDAPIYYPVVGTLFVFVFVSNLLGLIPGLLPPTDNLNTTLALGAFVFLYYNYAGLRAHGLAYLKHFMGPIVWLAPLMLIIEIVSHLFRPISLALRLRGNIMGDHIVLSVFSGLVPYLLPVVFYGLGVFVAFIQAFVFCLMTMVYISLSTSHDH